MTLLVTLLVLCTQTTTSAPPFAGFAPPQGARRLCAEHVNSPTMHITWQSYATAAAVDEVVAHYQKATGRTATRQPDGSHRLEWTADHVLSIYPTAMHDAFPHCAVRPTPDERTIVLISAAARR